MIGPNRVGPEVTFLLYSIKTFLNILPRTLSESLVCGYVCVGVCGCVRERMCVECVCVYGVLEPLSRSW